MSNQMGSAENPPRVKDVQQVACISCGKCKANCEFLAKYQLDFSKEEALRGLAYHCMLCGKCTQVCPIGIDGRSRILQMRIEQIQKQKGKLTGYRVLRGEKVNYKFKNYRSAKKKSVLFLGCNYPSLFPKTANQLIEMMGAEGIGVAFDCCGKPIQELGLEIEANRIIEKLNQRFKVHGIEELIVVCPNCYYYLKDKIEIPIVTIYEKLATMNTVLQEVDVRENTGVFVPCPDRREERWLKDIQQLTKQEIPKIEGIQCCGLGGVAVSQEPEYPSIMAKILKDKSCQTYVYCASCAGSFERNGVENIHHILNEMVGSDEVPDIKSSMMNRMKFKFK